MTETVIDTNSSEIFDRWGIGVFPVGCYRVELCDRGVPLSMSADIRWVD